MRKNLLMLSPVLCCSAQAQQLKPSNIIVNSLAILIQQCRAHTSQSFFVRISSYSCNKTYCSLYPLTFSGNTKACLDVPFPCSNDLGSCQTEIIPHYSQKKQLLLAFEEAAATETRTKVFTKVNILYMGSYRGGAGVLSMVLCLITEFQHAYTWIIVGGTAELSAFFFSCCFLPCSSCVRPHPCHSR